MIALNTSAQITGGQSLIGCNRIKDIGESGGYGKRPQPQDIPDRIGYKHEHF
jgi:hypothetical protein